MFNGALVWVRRYFFGKELIAYDQYFTTAETRQIKLGIVVLEYKIAHYVHGIVSFYARIPFVYKIFVHFFQTRVSHIRSYP